MQLYDINAALLLLLLRSFFSLFSSGDVVVVVGDDVPFFHLPLLHATRSRHDRRRASSDDDIADAERCADNRVTC